MLYYLPNDERIKVKQNEFMISHGELPSFTYKHQIKYNFLGYSYWRTINKTVDSSSLTPSLSIGRVKERLMIL